MINTGSRLLTVAFLLVFLSGCQTRIAANTSVYHNLPPEQKGDVFIAAYHEATNDSLEFKSFRSMIERKMLAQGYSVVSDPAVSVYTLLVSYGIDDGQTSTSVGSVPIYGQTGGGTTTHTGSVYSGGSYGSYSGTSYSMPTYGVVGSSTYSRTTTTYTRKLAIDMVKTESMSSGKIDKVYEGRVVSKGCTAQIAPVMPYLIEALFSDFPGDNGATKKIEIPTPELKC